MGVFGGSSIFFDIFVFPSVINYILSFHSKSKKKFVGLALVCLIVRIIYEIAMMEPNFYLLCGVDRLFTSQKLFQQFKNIKNPTKETSTAFSILKNLQLKVVYDKFGKEKFASHNLKDLTNPSILFFGCLEKIFFYGFSYFLSRYIFKRKREGDNILSKFYLLTLFYVIFECSMILDDQSTSDLLDLIFPIATFEKVQLIRSTFWPMQNIMHNYYQVFYDSDNLQIFFRVKKMKSRLKRLMDSGTLPKNYKQVEEKSMTDIDETLETIKELEDPTEKSSTDPKYNKEIMIFIVINIIVYYVNRR